MQQKSTRNMEKENKQMNKIKEKSQIRNIKLKEAQMMYETFTEKSFGSEHNIDILIGNDTGDQKRMVLLFLNSVQNVGNQIPTTIYVFNKIRKKWENTYIIHSDIDFYSINRNNKDQLERKEWKLLVDENLKIIEMNPCHFQTKNASMKKTKKKKRIDKKNDIQTYLNQKVMNKTSKESFGRIIKSYKYIFITNTDIVLKRLTENIEWVLDEKK